MFDGLVGLGCELGEWEEARLKEDRVGFTVEGFVVMVLSVVFILRILGVMGYV